MSRKKAIFKRLGHVSGDAFLKGSQLEGNNQHQALVDFLAYLRKSPADNTIKTQLSGLISENSLPIFSRLLGPFTNQLVKRLVASRRHFTVRVTRGLCFLAYKMNRTRG